MSLTTTEEFGFADKLIEYLTAHQAELLAVGLDVSGWITDIQTKKSTAVSKDQTQEAAKTAQSEATTQTVAALQTLYDTVSSKVDAAAGAVGKTTPTGKQILNIRSDIRRGPGPAPTTPANP